MKVTHISDRDPVTKEQEECNHLSVYYKKNGLVFGTSRCLRCNFVGTVIYSYPIEILEEKHENRRLYNW